MASTISAASKESREGSRTSVTAPESRVEVVSSPLTSTHVDTSLIISIGTPSAGLPGASFTRRPRNQRPETNSGVARQPTTPGSGTRWLNDTT